MQRPAHRAHLLLAARERAGLLVAPLLEAREEVEDARRCPPRCRPCRCAGTRPSRGSRSRVMRANSRRPSGDWAIPSLTICVGLRRVRSSPSNVMLPLRGRSEPEIVLQRRRLAGAVRADQRDDLALADVQRDALERVDARRSRRARPRARAALGAAWTRVPRSRCSRLLRRRPRAEVGLDHALVRASPRAASPRRSSRRGRAPSRARRRPCTTFMSCSISSTVRPRSSRILRTNAVNAARLLRVHAGGRLVEQQQLRLGRERPGDLEPALVAVGEVARVVLLGALRQAARSASSSARLLARLAPPRGAAAACARCCGRRRPACGSACPRARSRARSWCRRGGCSGMCARCPSAVIWCCGSPASSRPSNRISPAVGV